MALYRYFKPATDLPNPLASFIVAGLRHFDNEPFAKGSLSKCLSHATIKDANEVVKNSPKPAKSRGTYAKLTLEKQAEIAQYVVLQGNKAAGYPSFIPRTRIWDERKFCQCVEK